MTTQARTNSETSLHSPKPWTQGYKGKFETHNASNIYDKNGNCVAAIPGIPLHCSLEELQRSGNASDAEGMANARLIAKAPEFLEALRDIRKIGETGDCFGMAVSMLEIAREILEKTETY